MALEKFNNGESKSSIRTKINASIDRVNELDTVAVSFSNQLTFDSNKTMDNALTQSGSISYTLASSGNKRGAVIVHKILSNGNNPISFSGDFLVFSKPENNIYPSGIHVFYFCFMGNEVHVNIPTYIPESSSGSGGEAPSVPQNLQATAVGSDSLTLNWDASTDPDSFTWDYKIRQNGTVVKTVDQETLSTSITGLTPDTAYSFTVSAIDAEGNESAESTPVNVTTAEVVATQRTPDQVTNMVRWWDGTDETEMTIVETNNVSSWTDKIGSQNITQGTGSAQPRFFTGLIDFIDNTNLKGSAISALSANSDYHGFIVVRPGVIDASNPLIFNTLASDDRFSLTIDSENKVLHTTDNGTRKVKKGGEINNTDFHIIEFKNKDGNPTVFLNSIELTEEDTTAWTDSNNGFTVGKHLNTSGYTNNAEIKCICFASGEIGSTERAELINYLNTLI